MDSGAGAGVGGEIRTSATNIRICTDEAGFQQTSSETLAAMGSCISRRRLGAVSSFVSGGFVGDEDTPPLEGLQIGWVYKRSTQGQKQEQSQRRRTAVSAPHDLALGKSVAIFTCGCVTLAADCCLRCGMRQLPWGNPLLPRRAGEWASRYCC